MRILIDRNVATRIGKGAGRRGRYQICAVASVINEPPLLRWNAQIHLIGKIDEKLELYIEEVIEKSKIKKGSIIYEHGISVGKVAELLGLSTWELMNYIGKTTIADAGRERINVERRLAFARELFAGR